MATADVTVMGAGIFGLSVAFACAKRGAKVRVIDPHGVAAGSSGGVVGALAPHVPENWNAKKAFQLESLLMAEAYWADVTERTGCDTGYARSGRLQPLNDDAAVSLARAREETAKELWQGRASWQVIPMPSGAWVPPSASGLVVHDTLSALIHPRKATAALAAAVTVLGGEIARAGEPVGKVVWATGWAGVRPRSRSRAPILGAHPFQQDAFIANGGFKIGFGMAPKVGDVMADLVLDARQTYPDDFDVAASL